MISGFGFSIAYFLSWWINRSLAIMFISSGFFFSFYESPKRSIMSTWKGESPSVLNLPSASIFMLQIFLNAWISDDSSMTSSFPKTFLLNQPPIDYASCFFFSIALILSMNSSESFIVGASVFIFKAMISASYLLLNNSPTDPTG